MWFCELHPKIYLTQAGPTVDNAEIFIDSVSEVVSELNENEQTSDNLVHVATAITSIEELAATGKLIVTKNVSASGNGGINGTSF